MAEQLQGGIVYDPNNPVKAPVVLTSVARLLNNTSIKDVGRLCISENINKWAKYKPINHTELFMLKNEQFRGSATDVANKIIYGLKVGAPTTWTDLHSADYEYVGRPKGGQFSPYRMSDFIDYFHNAKPDITGQTYSEYEGKFVLTILRATYSSDYSVKLSDIVGSSLAGGAEGLYPCIMVDNYVHALKNSRTGTYTPLTYDNVQYYNFEIDVPLSTPDWKTRTERTVTFFLAQYIQNAAIDMTNWVNTSGQLTSIPTLITIPDVVGLKRDVYGYITVILDFAVTETSSGIYRVTFEGSKGLKLNLGDIVKLTYNNKTISYDVQVVMVSIPNPDLSNPVPIFRTETRIIVRASDFEVDSLMNKYVTFTAIQTNNGREYSVQRIFR